MAAQARGPAWSREENLLTVADYFDMLQAELQREPYVKLQRNEQLQRLLQSRSHGAVERKHQNISAILDRLDLPSIDGYKPLGHGQYDLEVVVREYLDRNPTVLATLRAIADQVPPEAHPAINFDHSQVEPPERRGESAGQYVRSAQRTTAPGFDFAAREAANRQLGTKGEEFVLESEQRRLTNAGHPELSKRVVHVSIVEGDGAGYDIRSFGARGAPLLIEVKTTNRGKRASFMITRNEVELSNREAECFALHRVFQFNRDPKFFVLPGPIESHVRLAPRTYVGRF